MFSEFWWGLSRFLISLVWMQFYLWKFLRICCSICQRSEIQWNSPVFCSDQCFLDFSEGFRKNGFTCPDKVLFVKVAQSLLQNLSKKRKHVVVLKSLRYFALVSVFCILVQNFRKLLNVSVLNWSEWRSSMFLNFDSWSPLQQLESELCNYTPDKRLVWFWTFGFPGFRMAFL